MPKLWKDTIDEHRRDVRAAILDSAWQLAREHGVLAVTMGRVAEQAGIGRATLYKYFAGVEEILVAAHTDHVTEHLTRLEAARATASSPGEALQELLAAYAQITFHRGRSGVIGLDGLVHAGDEHAKARQQLLGVFAAAIRDAQASGDVRADVSAVELAVYAVHGLGAGNEVANHASLKRLVDCVDAGLASTARRSARSQ